MPKRLRQQRRGKAKLVFSAPSFHFKYDTSYRSYDETEKSNKLSGEIVNLVDDSARTAPTMLIKYATGETVAIPAFMGAKVGEQIETGTRSEIKNGNTLPLKDIPAGASIYNIELAPGDGGKMIRSSGSSAKVVSKDGGKVTVRLPSKAFKILNENCRATVGIVAGYGRKEKPIIKAGTNYFIQRARGKYWPMVAGVAMNAINHPFGGKRRSTQKSKKHTVSRNAPPGRKVGSIAAKQTGRAKKE